MNLGAAKLLGILLESLGYGMFFVMFVYNTYLQVGNLPNRNTKRPNIILLIASTILFVMITSRWAIEVSRVYEAVVILEGRVRLSEYFADLTLKKQLAVSALFELQIVVADFILVYRLYHVWKPYWWLCIIPALTWIAVCISAGMLIWNMSNASPTPGVFQHEVEQWITASLSSTIANNVFCTIAIIVRLWMSHSTVAHTSSNSNIWRVLRIFVESASLFTVFMTVTFATFLAGYNIQYAFVDATSPVIGISFLLILLRLNFDKRETSSVSRDTVNKRGIFTNYPLRSINVSVSQHVDVESDLGSKTVVDRPSYGDMA